MEELRKVREEANKPMELKIPWRVYEPLENAAEHLKIPMDALATAVLEAFTDLLDEDQCLQFPLMFQQVKQA
jgi:hypothetical protein